MYSLVPLVLAMTRLLGSTVDPKIFLTSDNLIIYGSTRLLGSTVVPKMLTSDNLW